MAWPSLVKLCIPQNILHTMQKLIRRPVPATLSVTTADNETANKEAANHEAANAAADPTKRGASGARERREAGFRLKLRAPRSWIDRCESESAIAPPAAVVPSDAFRQATPRRTASMPCLVYAGTADGHSATSSPNRFKLVDAVSPSSEPSEEFPLKISGATSDSPASEPFGLRIWQAGDPWPRRQSGRFRLAPIARTARPATDARNGPPEPARAPDGDPDQPSQKASPAAAKADGPTRS